MNRPLSMQAFLRAHQLPESYIPLVKRWFESLAAEIARHQSQASRPLVVGINGSQGSGKSTLASLLNLILGSVHGLNVIDLSMDDFYLTRGQRLELADRVHPLLATRGVPGTHDAGLMSLTLKLLCESRASVPIPRFDKARDDRVPAEQWQHVQAPVDIVILEGWCLCTPAEDERELSVPVNELERVEDPEGTWRRYVNGCIDDCYSDIYDRVDISIMLQAPSFERVYQWRLEQEQKLAERHAGDTQGDNQVMSPAQIARFIQYYQRLTEQALHTLPDRVNYLYRLDADRKIIDATRPQPVKLA